MLSAILFAHVAARQCNFVYNRYTRGVDFQVLSYSKAYGKCLSIFHREEPCCVTTHWTQLTYRFHGRTVQPFLPSAARGCDEPTSRCQTNPSIRTLRIYKPVIPGVSLIRWSTFFPHQKAGSLPQTFVNEKDFSALLRSFSYCDSVFFRNSPCLACMPNSQAWFLGCQTLFPHKKVRPYLGTPLIFFERPPPQINSQALPKVFCFSKQKTPFQRKSMVVSHIVQNFSLERKFFASTSSEKDFLIKEEKRRVKMHGVSLSRESFLASSRECQIRPHPSRDRKLVMTPFMRVDNYSTRNFATLEPSELGLPFIGPSIFLLSQKWNISQHWAGVRLYTEFYNVAKPCVCVEQFPISFLCSLFLFETISKKKGLLLPKLRKYFAEFLCWGYVLSFAYSTMPPVLVLYGLSKKTFFSFLQWRNKTCVHQDFFLSILEWKLWESNPRPLACKTSALPTELNSLEKFLHIFSICLSIAPWRKKHCLFFPKASTYLFKHCNS